MKINNELNYLYEKVLEAYNNAYAPYSKFQVGAAVELDNGEIITGANVENASYGLCNCAERSALFSVYSKGYRKENIVRMMIIANTKNPVSPCGACRQVISELVGSEVDVFLTNLNKDVKVLKVKELLPYAFTEGDLNE